ncbi:LamG-like jellyroll fold domain-containing protein, partial [Actinoplanes sp. NPDC051633]|uniref:LamG domain-containing protein n=1 Tax=Actinoplanes sp. NPDC051633 TaxID=3155670 RepID=UPI0034466D26
PPPCTAEAATEEAAAEMALRCGTPVENLAERTELAQTFVDPAGTMTTKVGVTPQRVHRPDGSWAPVKTDLQRRSDGALVPEAAVADIAFSDGGDEPFATWRSGGSAFELSWPSALRPPRIEGDTAVYPEVYPGVDLHVTALADGFQHTLEVKSADAADNPELREIHYEVGGTARVVAGEDGAVNLVNSAGEPFATTAGAAMWDSAAAPAAAPAPATNRKMAAATDGEGSDARAPGPAAKTSPVAVQIDGDGLSVTPDPALLTGPATVYPVFIDPPFNGKSNKWAWADDENKDWGVGNRAQVGRNPYDGTLFRSFFQFDISTMHRVAGTKVLKAHIEMLLDHSWSCDSTWVHLYRVGGLNGTNGARMAWSTRPLPSGTRIDAWEGHANEESGCNGKIEPDAKAVFDGGGVKSDVQYGVSQGWNAYAVGLCACNEDGGYESTQDRWKKFFTDKTYLVATYDKQPDKPAPQPFSKTTDCYKACSSPATVRAVKPVLNAKVTDPYGGNLDVTFEVRATASDTGTLVAGTGTKPVVKASGNVASWQVSATLRNATTYYWRAKAVDENDLAGDWSGWQTLIVDTAPPALPAVTSDSFPYKEWGALVGTAGQFALSDASTDTADFVWSVDGGASTTTAAAGTPKSATAPHTPLTDLVHVLHARALDLAGNTSATSDHQFWISSPPSRCSIWTMNEASGTTVADTGKAECSPDDATVATAAGSLTGSATFQAGFSGNAVSFTAPGGAVTMAGPVVDTDKSFTVTTWVKPADLARGTQTAISQDGTTASRFQLRYLASANAGRGGWCFAMRGTSEVCATGTVADDLGRTHEPVNDTWVHLAAVYNAPAQTMQLHVMGNPTSCAGEMVQAPFTGAADTSGGPLVAGRAQAGAEAWTGAVDEVRAYPIALSTTKICQLASE